MFLPTRAALADLVSGDAPFAVIDEIQAGQGVVDLLAARLDEAAIGRRLAAGMGPIDRPLRVRVLDALPGSSRSISLDLLARRVGSRPKPLTQSTLQPLAELGLIELAGAKVRSTGVWSPLPIQLTAVELKLSKWREAVRQADNAAWCCDHAWVVLDRERSTAACAHPDYFRCFGVGLALLEASGQLTVVQRPRRRRHIRWIRSLVGEYAWARLLATTD